MAVSQERRRVAAALARACRPNSSTADQADHLRTELRTITLKEHIAAELARKPPFKPEQIERIRALFDLDSE